jgi:hypothetical protein
VEAAINSTIGRIAKDPIQSQKIDQPELKLKGNRNHEEEQTVDCKFGDASNDCAAAVRGLAERQGS